MTIQTEADWLACDQPEAIGYFLHRLPEYAIQHPTIVHPDVRQLWLLYFSLLMVWARCADQVADESGLEPSERCRASNSAAWSRTCCNDGFDWLEGRISVATVFRRAYPKRVFPDDLKPDSAWDHLRGALDDGSCHWKPGVAQEVCWRVRDILGNPFRPVALGDYRPGPTVLSLLSEARKGYCRHTGLLEPDTLVVLADALEEDGLLLAHPVILHLRQPGGHAYGCWAIEMLEARRRVLCPCDHQ